jgi:general secretion pathway protein A
MVLNYYKLAEQPFGVTPDPRYLYMSPTHREALASALYGITVGRGFTALIAKPGMGKTTILFHLLQRLQDSARTVFLFQTQSSPRDLLRSVLVDLGIEDDGGDLVQLQAKMNQALLQHSTSGKRFVVVIDEAQNLDEGVLEVVRMLSNFETPREKLMQIVLAGQPQLAKRLALPSMEQLRQRISIVARLMPLDEAETKAYIEHRLSVAGYHSQTPMFTDRAYAMIAKHSGGIPRNINNLCFNAMSLGCVRKQDTIDRDVIKEVLTDLDLSPLFDGAPEPSRSTGAVSSPALSPITLPGSSIAAKLSKPANTSWMLKVGAAAAAVTLGAIAWTATRPHFVANAADEPKAASTVSAAPAVTPAVVPSATPAATTPVATPVQSPTPAVQTSPVTTSSASLMESSDKTNAPARTEHALPEQAFRTIQVVRNETLFGISMENYGRYDQQIVDVILQMNPWLNDPDHIRAGQKIRIPVVQQDSNLSNTAAPSAAEVNKQ